MYLPAAPPDLLFAEINTKRKYTTQTVAKALSNQGSRIQYRYPVCKHINCMLHMYSIRYDAPHAYSPMHQVHSCITDPSHSVQVYLIPTEYLVYPPTTPTRV